MKSAFFSQPVPQRFDDPLFLLGVDRPHQKSTVLTDLHCLNEVDDARMTHLVFAENISLVSHPIVLAGIVGDLQNIILSVTFNQQRDTASALTKSANDGVTTGKQVADLSSRRIIDVVMFGFGEVVFDFVQDTEKVGSAAHSIGHDGLRCVPN